MTFKAIYHLAIERKGGENQLKKLLLPIASQNDLGKIGDDRFLAMMCKAINQAGFNWTVINNKWLQFEEAFYNFNVEKLYFMPPEKWEAYTKDTRVVRNWIKIKAVMENTGFVYNVAHDHGSFAKFIADWPTSDQIGLLAYLKKNGSRLGGNTGQWFLRYVGKDSYTTSHDVIQAIKKQGYEIKDNPTSKRDLTVVQNVFNQWHEETGMCYTHLSKIAAYSTGENYQPKVIIEQQQKFATINQ